MKKEWFLARKKEKKGRIIARLRLTWKDDREGKARKGRRMRKKVKSGVKLEEGGKENREGERMLVENVMSWMEERRKEGGESGQGTQSDSINE